MEDEAIWETCDDRSEPATVGSAQKCGFSSAFIWQHFEAVLYRRVIIVKRSWRSALFAVLATFLCSAFAAVSYFMASGLGDISNPQPFGFNSYSIKTNELVFAYEQSKMHDAVYVDAVNEYYAAFVALFRDDRGEEPHVRNFSSRASLNDHMYMCSKDRSQCPPRVSLGIGVGAVAGAAGDAETELVVYYNATEGDADRIAQVAGFRVEWRAYLGTDFWAAGCRLIKRRKEMIFAYLAPLLVSTGLLAIVPLLISQPISDLADGVREYMEQCTMSVFCYWAASFVVDWAFWIASVALVMALFCACQIRAFLDNAGTVFWGFVFAGPGTIIFMYCLCFAFQSPESASRLAFMVMDVMCVIPVVVDAARMSWTWVWLDWIYSFIPSLHTLRLMSWVLGNVGPRKHNWAWYWGNANSQAFMIMEWVCPVLWGFVLWCIERGRHKLRARRAISSFVDHAQIFEELRREHPVTDEAVDMEEKVKRKMGGAMWAVRCEDVSRLFFSTAGEPIAAVNNVSLGVEAGTIFGFLGANGAGKTTLIKMITGELPVSHGTIEVFGEDIAASRDRTALAVCPQFNTHLCRELSAREHFHLYSMLFQLSEAEEEAETSRLIATMGLEEIAEQPVSQLSGGDVRKVSIALSFLGPARIILLDEPTASLDAVGRRAVHEMIMAYKGEKTFMLCTHLLSEAEELCDEISVMIRGCVYTIGTPEYLTAKFGKDFKVDVGLVDDSDETGERCQAFFEQRVPGATLAIIRPRARIYNVPSQAYSLARLFALMDSGKRDCARTGIHYYTCSSSSLERVFRELVRISEDDPGPLG